MHFQGQASPLLHPLLKSFPQEGMGSTARSKHRFSFSLIQDNTAKIQLEILFFGTDFNADSLINLQMLKGNKRRMPVVL